MIEADFVEALNHSIDRVNAGDSIADCLVLYPQYAARLESLLEVGGLVRRASVDSGEAVRARERQRLRFEQTLNRPQSPSSRRPISLRWSFGLVASLVLFLVLFAGGAGIIAESSLPGDALYDLKLWTESIRLSLTNNDPNLQATFAERRIDEAQHLIQLRRQAEMTFTGIVEVVTPDALVIDGVLVTIQDARIPLGSRVEVNVMSTYQGELIARQIRVIEAPPNALPPPVTSAQTPTPTSQLTRRTDSTMSLIDATMPLPTSEPTADQSRGGDGNEIDCRVPPLRWERYVVQRGDTLSALAVASDGDLDEIMTANCLEDARFIFVGQMIYLPRLPIQTITPTTAVERPEPERPPPSPTPTPTRELPR